MFRVIVLCTVLACALANVVMPRSTVPQLDGRIVGGENADITSFPYQVSVRMFGTHSCGGTIYNSRVIVTAAHCIFSMVGAKSYSIQYGQTVVGGSNNVISAERILKHNLYNANTIDHDVALIFLTSDIPFSSVAQPIPLATRNPEPGTPAIVTGWGATSEGGSSASILQKVEVQIVKPDTCIAQYIDQNEITKNMLCAAVNGGGKDACQGDSGGPMVANGELVGVVSWGIGCARPEFSGIYSSVANLLPWIEANIS